MRAYSMIFAAMVMGITVSAADLTAADFAKLDRIRIPSMEAQDCTVEEALDFLRLRSIELDPEREKEARKGVSFVVRPPAKPPSKEEQSPGDSAGLAPIVPAATKVQRINFSGKDVTVMEVLREISRQTKLDIHLTSVGFVLCEPGTAPFPGDTSKGKKIFRTIHPEEKAQERSVPPTAAPPNPR